jgi:hypothetical protein
MTPMLQTPMLRTLLMLSLLVAASPPAFAQEELKALFGQKPKPLIDQAGFFSVILPSGFDCEAAARVVNCQGTRGPQATLAITVFDVPKSATVEAIFLNESDKFSALPHYQLLKKSKQKLDKTPAILASYKYDMNGNVEYSVGVQSFYMVRANKGYLIQFQSRLDQFVVYQKDLKDLYATFKAARVDAGGNPFFEDLNPNEKKKNTDAELEAAKALGY